MPPDFIQNIVRDILSPASSDDLHTEFADPVLLGALEELKQTDETVYNSDVKKLHETAIGRMARTEEELLKAIKPPEPEDKRAGRKIQRTGQTTPAIYKLQIPGDGKIPRCDICNQWQSFMQGLYCGAYPRRSQSIC